MNLGYRLYQEQSQRLVMTTQMKQAIELLQCTAMELHQQAVQLASANPFAEVESTAQDLEDLWWMRPASRTYTPCGRDKNPFPLEQIIGTDRTMAEELVDQIRWMKAPKSVTRLAGLLAQCLDENGYLRDSEEELCRCLGVEPAQFSRAVELLQSCEPRGMGARSLQECLRLQLDLIPTELRQLSECLIDHHLDEIGAGRLPAIARSCRVSVTAVQAAVDAIRTLNPRPGLAYKSGNPEYVIPDVVVERVGHEFIVLNNDYAQPRIRVNGDYHRMLMQSTESEVRDYLLKTFQSAQWFARCLEQRRLTLYRVAQAIVDAQDGFFRHGVLAMKPLTLHQIGDALGIHESTVSRATRGKYMLTPRGLFEMKFFFTSEVQSEDGSTTSAQCAKHEIRRLVEEEDRQHPLSDDAIARALKHVGIVISRRTVAKYREELRIAPSWRRKRYE